MDAATIAAAVSPATSDHRPLGIDAKRCDMCPCHFGRRCVNGVICVHVFWSLPTIVISVGITHLSKHKTISIYVSIHSICRMFVRSL
jgi:hypothetical protein